MNQFASEFEAVKNRDTMESLHPRVPRIIDQLIAAITTNVPVGGQILSQFHDCVQKKENQNLQLYIEALRNDVSRELQSQQRSIEDINEKLNEVRAVNILVDGASRAQQSSSVEKARRLGAVAARGIFNHAEDTLEKVTEFLRFAEELSETDILVLRAMKTAQANCQPDRFRGARADSVRSVMNDFKVDLPNGDPLDFAYVKSSFARLQSLGVVIQLSSQSNTSPMMFPFELLRLGEEFLDYLGSLT